MLLEQISPNEFIVYTGEPLGTPKIRVRNTLVPIARWHYELVNTLERQLYSRNDLIANMNLDFSGMINPNQPAFRHYKLHIETARPVLEEEKIDFFFSNQPFGVV